MKANCSTLLYVRRFRTQGFNKLLKENPQLISWHMICKQTEIMMKTNRNLAHGVDKHTVVYMKEEQ